MYLVACGRENLRDAELGITTASISETKSIFNNVIQPFLAFRRCKVSHYFTNNHKIRASTGRYYNCLRFEYDFAEKIIL